MFVGGFEIPRQKFRDLKGYQQHDEGITKSATLLAHPAFSFDIHICVALAKMVTGSRFVDRKAERQFG